MVLAAGRGEMRGYGVLFPLAKLRSSACQLPSLSLLDTIGGL